MSREIHEDEWPDEQSFVVTCGAKMYALFMRNRLITLLLAVILSSPVLKACMAEKKTYPKAKVSFEDFKGLVSAVEKHRKSRLVDFDTFLKMSKEPGTIIFDSRSDFRFDRIHLKGALHLSFTDFTQDNLKKVIPSFETRILIYCNNNFRGNETDFASKVALIPSRISPNLDPDPLKTQISTQEKPRMMALNIPTYVNLFGYGYQNIYELDELVDVKDSRVNFEGSLAKGQ